MSDRGWVAVSLALGLGLSACISVNTGGDDDGGDASLSIDSLAVAPETVADGESFEVRAQLRGCLRDATRVAYLPVSSKS